jgi:hypothetical protein
MRTARLAALLLCVSCGTLAGSAGVPQGLPSSGVGPFRALQDGELAPAAVVPYVFSSSSALYREPSVIGTSTDPSSTEVWMYAVAKVGGVDVIVRTRADDARSFYGDLADNSDTSHPMHVPPVVLQADQPWEGGATGNLAGPSALMVGGQLWLYYAAAGGIGLAQSSDGLTGFTKQSGPVLAPDPSATWETTTPHAPTVAVFPDGSWHMMYGAGGSIGEATSTDGIHWTRADANPILAPSPAVDPSTLGPGVEPPFDEGQVDDPMLAPQTTVDGRLQVRVLYTGYGEAADGGVPSSAIGFAARFDADPAALSRQPDPVYTVKLHEKAPAFFEWSGGSLVYVGEDDTSISTSMPFAAVAAGYAPATATLPAPAPYPSTP